MTLESYSSVLTALAIWREARGESQEARRGVLHVILNRVASNFRGNNPVSGRCFIRAGFRVCGLTRTGLVILECLP